MDLIMETGMKREASFLILSHSAGPNRAEVIIVQTSFCSAEEKSEAADRLTITVNAEDLYRSFQ